MEGGYTYCSVGSLQHLIVFDDTTTIIMNAITAIVGGYVVVAGAIIFVIDVRHITIITIIPIIIIISIVLIMNVAHNVAVGTVASAETIVMEGAITIMLEIIH